jgi:photosystem II stability/assembly factor-like uncharacterized protein
MVLASCGGNLGGNQAIHSVWRTQTSGTNQRLDDVACLSTMRCEAVGQDGTIIATTDGGATWRAQGNPMQGSPTELYRVTCMPPSSCYVIARPDTILVTHDGGSSWSSHVLRVGVKGSTLTDSACLANYTTIGGRPSLCRLGLLDIGCVSADVCYAIATEPPAYNDQPRSPTAPAADSIWMTDDGGSSWAPQVVPLGVACDGDCAGGLYGYPLTWVSCLSGGLCRAGGGHVLGCGHCGFAYAVLVMRGTDMTWTCAGAAPGCTSLAPDAGDCAASTICYGVQSTNPFGPETTVVRSTDGGARWVQIGPSSASVLNDIACRTAQTCYVAGSRGTIAQITDGTIAATQTVPTTSDVLGIDCVGTATCFAVGDEGTIVALR